MNDDVLIADKKFAALIIDANLDTCKIFAKKVYEGIRLKSNYLVLRNGAPLHPGVHIADIKKGFAWGDDSTGSSQLAHVILLDLLGYPMVADLYCYIFLEEIIEKLPSKEGEKWILTDHDILSILARKSDFKTQLSRYYADSI